MLKKCAILCLQTVKHIIKTKMKIATRKTWKNSGSRRRHRLSVHVQLYILYEQVIDLFCMYSWLWLRRRLLFQAAILCPSINKKSLLISFSNEVSIPDLSPFLCANFQFSCMIWIHFAHISQLVTNATVCTFGMTMRCILLFIQLFVEKIKSLVYGDKCVCVCVYE